MKIMMLLILIHSFPEYTTIFNEEAFNLGQITKIQLTNLQ